MLYMVFGKWWEIKNKSMNTTKLPSNKILKDLSVEICKESEDWIKEYMFYAPTQVLKRKKSMKSIKNLVKTFLGISIKPRFNEINKLYIFEGIRFKEYMKAFSPENVVVVGSYVEKKFAEY